MGAVAKNVGIETLRANQPNYSLSDEKKFEYIYIYLIINPLDIVLLIAMVD